MRKLITISFILVTIACVNNYATNILVVGADGPNYLEDVASKLSATGLFENVDVFAAGDSTPTLEFLLNYDAVLYWTDNPPLSRENLGTVIKNYIDAGGGFVDAVFETGNYEPLVGEYTDDYRVVVPENYEYTSGSLVTRNIPNHPILANVDTFYTKEFRATTTTFQENAYPIASYSDKWLIAAKEGIGARKVRRVSLNLFPPSSDVNGDSWSSNTDGAIIMANSLIWVSTVDISGEQKAVIGIPDTLTFNKLAGDTILKWHKKTIGTDWEIYNEVDSVIIENYSEPDTLYYKVDYIRDTDTITTIAYEVIAKYAQTITFPKLSEMALNQEDVDPEATASSELMVTYSSSDTNIVSIIDGKLHPKMVDTCVVYANQEGDNNYWPAEQVLDTIIVKAGSQTLTFDALPEKTYGDADFDPGASVSSGLDISYSSSNTNIAAIVEGNIHIVSAGTCTISANQEGNDTLIAAEQVQQQLVIAKAIASVTISDTAYVFDGTSKSVSTSTTPVGLTVKVTYDGSEVAPSNAGSYTVIATIDDINYQGADTATLVIDEKINVNNASIAKMQIFPNPVNDILTINSEDSFIEYYIVYSLTGNVVLSQVVNQKNVEIDFAGIEKGMYFVRIMTNCGEYTEKVIK